jgi:methionyl-tRNA synthetase
MKYLVTSALPYANGPIHFGHIAGVYLPADIYTKHLKLKGERAIHICGSDEHGVAIMQNAQKAGKNYQEYVNQWHQEHKHLFDKYEIKFEFFGQTSAPYHAKEVVTWFKVLNDKGFIEKKAEDQLQCQDCKNYLPDRFVEGTCYVCGYAEARGDECPECGTWIDATKLKNPTCKFCHSKNIEVKSVDQWYLKLTKFHADFRKWFNDKKHWRKTVYSFVDSLSKESMVDRAITRDLDWGIDVPLPEAIKKKLYVWFDAPIGYVSNTKEYLEKNVPNEDYLKDWWNNNDTKIVNFIGKDNIIFHAIIFPMMCLCSGITRAVDELPANQYVNLEGKQFSKSKGWYVDAHEAIDTFGTDALRFYLTSLIPETADSSFTWKGFEAKINSELANNIGNFVNRGMKFFYKNWQSGIPAEVAFSFFKTDHAKKLQERIKAYHETMTEISIKGGLEELMKLGFDANAYFSERAPWAQFKTDPKLAEETIAHSAIYVIYLGVLFEPFLPKLASDIQSYFGPMNADMKKKIYMGEESAVKEYIGANLLLKVEPQGLVPKIDSKVIEALEAKLKEKA